ARLAQQGAERAALDAERGELAAKVAQLGAAIVAAPERYDEARHLVVRQQIALLEPQAFAAERLRASADRATDLVRRAALAEQELSRLEAQVRALRAKLQGLGWSAETFGEIRERTRLAERAVQQADLGKARAAGELAGRGRAPPGAGSRLRRAADGFERRAAPGSLRARVGVPPGPQLRPVC